MKKLHKEFDAHPLSQNDSEKEYDCETGGPEPTVEYMGYRAVQIALVHPAISSVLVHTASHGRRVSLNKILGTQASFSV